MATLLEQLSEQPKRGEVIRDAMGVLDAEVHDKGGLSGMAIKAAYKVVKGIKPGFVQEVIDGLLNDFLGALDPMYQEAVEQKVGPAQHLVKHSGQMAEGLLAITDARARSARREVIKKAYDKLRPTAKKHVEAAAPRLGQLLERHTAAAG